jgi:hypothetical protein
MAALRSQTLNRFDQYLASILRLQSTHFFHCFCVRVFCFDARYGGLVESPGLGDRLALKAVPGGLDLTQPRRGATLEDNSEVSVWFILAKRATQNLSLCLQT